MRVAIVNDMALAVEALRRVLAAVPEHEIAWVARDGAEAVDRCASDTPDIVLMDLMMPVMDGVEATRRIMQQAPCAILVVTATVSGHASKVFEAMGAGALDAVNTPVFGRGGQPEGGETLLAKIATIGKLIGKPVVEKGRREAGPVDRPPAGRNHQLVAIGASTGGPRALAALLSGLPAGFGGAVVIVQHVDAQFASGMCDWLDEQSPLRVRLAVEGCRPEAGVAWVAGTNDHLVLAPDLSLRYSAEPRDYPYRPSVDVFLNSVARHWPERCAAALLTGMGRDGAEGLLMLRRAGWHTIAQDEESSVVYGMPKAAAELGAAVEILPIGKIAPALIAFLSGEGKGL